MELLKPVREYKSYSEMSLWDAWPTTRDRSVINQVRKMYPNTRIYDSSNIQEIMQWCDENIGKNNWLRDGLDFYFTRPDQKLWFKLTWTEHD